MKILALWVSLALFSGCGTSTTSPSAATEDSSTSGAAAGAAGGAMSGSGSGGTIAFLEPSQKSLFQTFVAKAFEMVPNAFAATACPTFKTTGAGCTSGSHSLWLTYSGCSFGVSHATWTGVQELTMSTGTAACGSFPFVGGSTYLVSQFVAAASSTTTATATRTNALGTVVTIDDASTNLNNFSGDSIGSILNSGYGTKVTLSGSARNSISIARRISSPGKFDQSITGVLTVGETVGNPTRILSGNLTVYHNLLQVVGLSQFTNVIHKDTCCLPVSGTITTTFSAGSIPPTAAGSALVGKTETLTLTGCGTGTLVSATGSNQSVLLSNCF